MIHSSSFFSILFGHSIMANEIWGNQEIDVTIVSNTRNWHKILLNPSIKAMWVSQKAYSNRMASIHPASEVEREREITTEKKESLKIHSTTASSRKTNRKKTRIEIVFAEVFSLEWNLHSQRVSLTVYVTNHTIHSCSALYDDERLCMHYPVTVFFSCFQFVT